MGQTREPHNLEELIDDIEAIDSPSGRIRFDDVLDATGHRSFGPLLLIAGLITLIPVISGIPGVPTLMALFTLLVCVQLLLGRRTFWLPRWLRERNIEDSKVHKGLRWMRRPARFTDKFLHHRLAVMTGKTGRRLTAVACVLIALVMPPMEFIPFSASLAGAALSLFGLSLMARDGLLALLGFVATFAALLLVLPYVI